MHFEGISYYRQHAIFHAPYLPFICMLLRFYCILFYQVFGGEVVELLFLDCRSDWDWDHRFWRIRRTLWWFASIVGLLRCAGISAYDSSLQFSLEGIRLPHHFLLRYIFQHLNPHGQQGHRRLLMISQFSIKDFFDQIY